MRIRWLMMLYFSVLFVLMIGEVNAVSHTFTVPADGEVVKTIGLNEGDVVWGRVIVVGGSDNTIKFYVTDPNGNAILQFDRAGATDFRFTIANTGTHRFHFDNMQSGSDKTVTINYEVQRYIMGLPQEFFYVLVVALIGLIGVFVFVALSRS